MNNYCDNFQAFEVSAENFVRCILTKEDKRLVFYLHIHFFSLLLAITVAFFCKINILYGAALWGLLMISGF